LSDPAALAVELARLSRDPLRFVLWAFPWGSGILEKSAGPEPWQIDVLQDIRDGLLTPDQAILEATASGHGIGKSALVAWLILWGLSTFEDTKGVVTANTETQLKTKTWAELAKWFHIFVARDLFKMTATAIFSADPEHERTWRIDMVPWSERNTEAFAGLHNKGKRIILIFDEGSAIPDVIWEVAEGALTDTDTQILWAVFGNPTRNTGRFKACFESLAHRWRNRTIDSRTVSFTNKAQIARWVKDYGDDSDFVRVRVKGAFPRAGSLQFIPSDLVEAAAVREVVAYRFEPLIIGVDVARFGDDSSYIVFRKGRDARGIPPIKLQGADTMQVAERVANVVAQYRPDAVMVDGGGVGGGVVDRLRQLRIGVLEVQFGAKSDAVHADEPDVKYHNKRAEIWGSMKFWLRTGGIPDEQEYKAQLIGPEYGYSKQEAIQLERKQDMKKRGLVSPDWADALACTFAYTVVPNLDAGPTDKPLYESDYDPLDYAKVA
jgi:hypothetical protein